MSKKDGKKTITTVAIVYAWSHESQQNYRINLTYYTRGGRTAHHHQQHPQAQTRNCASSTHVKGNQELLRVSRQLRKLQTCGHHQICQAIHTLSSDRSNISPRWDLTFSCCVTPTFSKAMWSTLAPENRNYLGIDCEACEVFRQTRKEKQFFFNPNHAGTTYVIIK